MFQNTSLTDFTFPDGRRWLVNKAYVVSLRQIDADSTAVCTLDGKEQVVQSPYVELVRRLFPTSNGEPFE